MTIHLTQLMASDEGIEPSGFKVETGEPSLRWRGENDADNPYGRHSGSVS
jgi:hypothetical protein